MMEHTTGLKLELVVGAESSIRGRIGRFSIEETYYSYL
ncbi:hypothetical protein HALLA_01000 (plasmid) [Halostagnicola larsenii XH-48]|uniref:Uncharacterized protein n=1 Tax=Halostagnicola larsenii XH-48 TaxID=797299 RepID=W0JY26_9EURY|nr:hypothetical protein HALLA_01000 [Halostagnicola larsenii XH-48]